MLAKKIFGWKKNVGPKNVWSKKTFADFEFSGGEK